MEVHVSQPYIKTGMTGITVDCDDLTTTSTSTDEGDHDDDDDSDIYSTIIAARTNCSLI